MQIKRAVSLACRSFYFPQLIPEAYVTTTPLLLPFPSSHNVLENTALHGIARNGQLISRVVPGECCWFAQGGHPAASRIPDGFLVTRASINFHFSSPRIEARVESLQNRDNREQGWIAWTTAPIKSPLRLNCADLRGLVRLFSSLEREKMDPAEGGGRAADKASGRARARQSRRRSLRESHE